MENQKPFKEYTEIPDKTFPLNVFKVSRPNPIWIPLHWHDHLEWMLVRKGSFRIQIQNHFADLYEGDVLFVNTKEIHAAFPLQEGADLTAIVFNDALLRNLALDNIEKKYVLPILNYEVRVPSILKADDSITCAISSCLEEITKEYEEKQKGYELFIKSHLIHSIALIYRISENNLESNPYQKDNISIQKILRHLSNTFQEPITITEAARICNLSPNYFCTIFKKATGKTFTEYINMLRVHEADQLLREGNLTVSEAALNVGFTNLTYFGRVFKQYKTLRPSDVLKQAKEKNIYHLK
jgi:AraC family transcriptional regulator, transcriptional activator of pobA